MIFITASFRFVSQGLIREIELQGDTYARTYLYTQIIH